MTPIRHLDLHLTHRCTLRCTYCYAGLGASGLPPDLTPELADRAVDFLLASCGDAPRLRLDFWGGEPFMRPDLIRRAADRAREGAERLGRELTMVIPTNVTLLDREARKLVRDRGIELTLSLDGGPAAFGERQTVKGESGWQLIGPKLEELVADSSGPLPPVRMTIQPRQAGQLMENLSYLQDRGFRQISFMPASGTEWTVAATAILDGQLAQVADGLVSWLRAGRPRPPYYPPLLRRLSLLWTAAKSGATPLRSGFCGAGHTLIAVDTLGGLFPCHRIVARPNPPAGLRLGSLDEGLTNKALRARLSCLGADQPGMRCASCERRPGCGRLCIALNHQATGDIATIPDGACHVNDRLRLAALRIHQELIDTPRYEAYLEPFLTLDPDERMLPLLAALQSRSEDILDRAEALLASFKGRE